MSSPLAETTAAEAPEPKTDDMLVKEWNGVLSNGDERSLRSIADAIIKLSKLDTAELKAEGLRKVAAENIARTDQITPMIHGCIRLLAHEGYGRAEDAEKDDTTEGRRPFIRKCLEQLQVHGPPSPEDLEALVGLRKDLLAAKQALEAKQTEEEAESEAIGKRAKEAIAAAEQKEEDFKKREEDIKKREAALKMREDAQKESGSAGPEKRKWTVLASPGAAASGAVAAAAATPPKKAHQSHGTNAVSAASADSASALKGVESKANLYIADKNGQLCREKGMWLVRLVQGSGEKPQVAIVSKDSIPEEGDSVVCLTSVSKYLENNGHIAKGGTWVNKVFTPNGDGKVVCVKSKGERVDSKATNVSASALRHSRVMKKSQV